MNARPLTTTVPAPLRTIARAPAAPFSVVALGIAGLALLVYRQALSMRPFDVDNLVSYTIGADRSPWPIFTEPFANGTLPGYRPLTSFSLWVQYHVAGVGPKSYLLVNLLLWAG